MIVTVSRYLEDWKIQRRVNQDIKDSGKAQYELNKHLMRELAIIRSRLNRLECKK